MEAVLEYLYPTDTLPGTGQYYVGGALIVFSIVFVRSAMGSFRRADTPFKARRWL